jgi:hypothetical protein
VDVAPTSFLVRTFSGFSSGATTKCISGFELKRTYLLSWVSLGYNLMYERDLSILSRASFQESDSFVIDEF